MLGLAILAGATPLSANGVWLIGHEGPTCIASRDFGSGKDAVTLSFRQTVLSTGVTLSLMAAPGDGTVRQGTATILFDPPAPPLKLLYLSADVPERRGRLTLLYPGQSEEDEGRSLQTAAKKARSLTFRLSGQSSMTLTATDMGVGIESLRGCSREVAAGWGVPRAGIPAEPPELLGSPGQYFTKKDYPAAAVRERATGAVTALLTLAGDGGVRGCKVVESSQNAALDGATCDIAVAKLRYRVAPGTVETFTTLRVRWALPI